MKSIILALSILLLCTPSFTATLGSQVNIQFINISQFSTQPSQTFNDGNPPNGSLVTINTSIHYQTMLGAGAALTDSSAYVIHNLPEDKYWEVLKSLFGRESGIGINYIRLPISACDLSLTNWTYDNMPPGQTDPNLDHFSIDHDKAYIIPVIKDILKVNPEVKIMVTPWSAPAWMKSTDSLLGKVNETASVLLDEYYAAYANFFVKVIQAYEEEGILFDTMSIQNEPQYETPDYPGMIMQQDEQVNFINNFLAPAFIANGIKTQLLVFDHNWDGESYASYVLENLNSIGKQIIRGTSFHCYAGDPTNQTVLHNKFPSYSIFMTECGNHQWAPDVNQSFLKDMKEIFIGPTNNWAEVSLMWNLVLDENSGPHNGGVGGWWPLVTVNSKTQEITYNLDYYGTGMFSKFVKRGAKRVKVQSKDSNLLVTGFSNPDGSIVVMVVNQDVEEHTAVLSWEGQWIESSIEGITVGVFSWNP